MNKNLLMVYVVTLFFIPLISRGQPVFLKDIPTCGNFTGGKCQNQKFFGAGNNLYFFSNDSLWKSNGTTAGTAFVKKIGESVNFYSIIANGSDFYFTTLESGGNTALWKSDGISGNTVKVNAYLQITPLIIYNSELYLIIKDVSHGKELWKFNGSTLSLVKDINSGSGDGYVTSAAISGGLLYFVANNGTGNDIWKTDGTTSGTTMAVDMPFNNFYSLTDVNGVIFFVNVSSAGSYPDQNELWKTNGTLGGTVKVEEFGEEQVIYGLTSVRNKLLFFLDVYGFSTLMVSDGTAYGTFSLKGFGIDGYMVDWFVVNDYLVYYHDDQGYINNIWKSDGTPAGTTIFAHTPSTNPRSVTKVGNQLFYAEHDGPTDYGYVDNYEDSYQLFQSDLSVNNTKAVRKIFGAGSYPGSGNITEVNGKLYFTTYNDNYNAPSSEKVQKLYVYDPSKPATSSAYFTLVDADTDQDLGWLKTGDTITKYTNKNINVRYNPVGSVGSVVFKVNDVVRRTENVAPYSLAGDNNGDYSPWTEAAQGNYKLTATPYSSSGGTGTEGTSLIVNFYLKVVAPKQEPVANAGTDRDLYLPKDSIVLVGTSSDSDGYINYTGWSLTSGPAVSNITNLGANKALIKGLSVPGVYTFRLTVYDNDDNVGFDEMQLTVHSVPSGLAVQNFTLVNADTDTKIQLINDGEVLYLGNLSTSHLNIKINLNQPADSVVIRYDSTSTVKRTSSPYSFFGNTGNDYNTGTITPGFHRLIATPYKNSGTAGAPLTIYFTAIAGKPNVPPVADAGPDRTTFTPNFVIVGKKSDSDGTIVSAVWRAITIPQPNYYQRGDSLFLTFYNQFTSTFRYTVTDDKGAVTEDEVRVSYTSNPASVGIASIVLVNAETDTDIMTLSNGAVVDLAALPTQNINIKAVPNVTSGISEVVLYYNNTYTADYVSPYSLFGDVSGDYKPGKLESGSHTIKATAYGAGYIEGNSLTINISVINTGRILNSFTLVDADTDLDIKTLVNNEVINMGLLPTKNLNIRANTNPATVGSVKFNYDGTVKTENTAPYAYWGDNSGNYNAANIANGTHTITATPYSGSNGSGTVGIPLTISFTMINNGTAKFAVNEESSSTDINVYPNPSARQFAIELNELEEEWISVEIVDPRGGVIQVLFEGYASGNALYMQWDGSSHPEGIYICRIKSNQRIQNKKLFVK